MALYDFFFCYAITTDRFKVFQHIFGNQKKKVFYGPNFPTILFLLTSTKCIFIGCSYTILSIKQSFMIKHNKRNNKCFSNRGCSLFFLMGIFLKHL